MKAILSGYGGMIVLNNYNTQKSGIGQCVLQYDRGLRIYGDFHRAGEEIFYSREYIKGEYKLLPTWKFRVFIQKEDL